MKWSKRDKYGRTVVAVLTQDRKDICIEQTNRGMAWHYKKYAAEQASDDRSKYADAEKSSPIIKAGVVVSGYTSATMGMEKFKG